MAYVNPNFMTKKALKEAVNREERVTTYEPGLGEVPRNGRICVEGPHYPQPHTWYAVAIVCEGVVVRVE